MRTIRSKTAVRKLKEEYAAEHPALRQICFLLQDWSDPYNVGAMFRVADALGAEELILTGDTPEPQQEQRGRASVRAEFPQIAVTSLGAHRRVPWRKIQSHEEAATALKEEGWTLVAVEIADGAIPYTDFHFPDKVCLVLGSEQRGVYDKVLKHCSAAVFIPMAGKGRSLNVTHAAAVVGFWATHSHN